MREIGPFVPTTPTAPTGTRCSGRSRVAAARASRSTCARAEGQDLFRRLAATADVVVRELPARARSSAGTSRPADLDPTPRDRAHLQLRPGRPVLAAARARPGRHRLRRAAAPHRLPRPAAGARRRDDLRLPHRRVRRAGRDGGALRARRARRRHGRGDRRRALRRGAAHPRVDARRATTGSASCASREGNRLANSAPLDNYPTADGKYVCIVAGSDANFAPPLRGDGPARPRRRPALRAPRRPGRARRRDQRHRGRLDRARSTAAEIEERCVAHDVPVATAYTAADIFADPHMAARGDLVTVDDPVVGPLRQQAPFPRFVGEPVGAAQRRAAARRAHREVLGDAARPRRRRCSTARAGRASCERTRRSTTGCSTSTTTAITLLCGGRCRRCGTAPRSRASTRLPVLRRGRRRGRSRCPTTARSGAGPPSPRAARLPGRGAVRLRRRRAPRGPAGDHAPRGADPARLEFGHADAARRSSSSRTDDDGDQWSRRTPSHDRASSRP